MSNNPFEPPRSDIRIDEEDKDKRLGWKIFFWVIFLLSIFGYYFILVADDFSPITDILYMIFDLFMLMALFGYAFKKAFFQQSVWKVLLPIVLVKDVFSTVSEVMDTSFFQSPFSIWGEGMGMIIAIATVAVVVVPIAFFQYLALYRYGFTDRAPWHKKGK